MESNVITPEKPRQKSASLTEYPGLKFLTKTTEMVLRPLCQDPDGSKYYDIQDVKKGKMAMVVERRNGIEDVVIRDKFGVLRLCMYGAHEKGAQLDVYVTETKPIGIVKKGIVYDDTLAPICIIEPRSCCGPQSFNILSQDDKGPIGW